MRPKQPKTTGEGDLFRARLDQIINLKHELVQLTSAAAISTAARAMPLTSSSPPSGTTSASSSPG